MTVHVNVNVNVNAYKYQGLESIGGFEFYVRPSIDVNDGAI